MARSSLLISSCCTLALAALGAGSNAHAQSLSQCGGSQYLQLTSGPNTDPNNPNNITTPQAISAATATDPACQSDNISTANSLATLNFLQGFGNRATSNGLWGTASSEALSIKSAATGKGDNNIVAAGVDYNFGNQIPVHFGFGITSTKLHGSTPEAQTLAATSYKVSSVGVLGYAAYTRTFGNHDALSAEAVVNLSSLRTHSATAYQNHLYSVSPDGSSGALNLDLTYTHRLPASNSRLVGTVGIGSIANHFNGTELKNRTDTFTYISLTYAQEVSGALLYIGAQAQDASSKFHYGANSSITVLPTYSVAGGGTLTRGVAGALWQISPKWGANLIFSAASASHLKDTGVRLTLSRRFGV